MIRQFILINRSFKDLNPLIYGEEACCKSHSFGPYIRNYTIIHYVMQGCGVLYKNGNAYPVHQGEAFIILPGEITTYVADAEDPWYYRWIGFDGELSEKFAQMSSVISIPDGAFPNVVPTDENKGYLEYILAGQLFWLLSELSVGKKHRNHYVRQVENYIRSAYMEEISVEQIAEQLNLDRRYLSRLFKEKTGMTVQEYLISVRMEEAQRQLSEGRSVSEAALYCGYPDACNFSKMFKRFCGVSPANWKKRKAL